MSEDHTVSTTNDLHEPLVRTEQFEPKQLNGAPDDAEIADAEIADAEIDDDADDSEYWDEEPLPPPRASVMTPVTWALVILMSLGVGFAVGARTERSHATSVAQAAVAAQFAQARNRAGGFGGGGFGQAGTGATGGAATGGATTGGATTGGAAATPVASGTIKLIDGRKVYVADSAGNIAIAVAPASLDISALKTGEQVAVQGTTGTDGTIAATAITPSSTTGTGSTIPAGSTPAATAPPP
jgi:hypothetical protein